MQGTEVCESEWGKALGKGLYELRIRHDANEILRERDPELFARIGPLPAEPTLLQRGQINASMVTGCPAAAPGRSGPS